MGGGTVAAFTCRIPTGCRPWSFVSLDEPLASELRRVGAEADGLSQAERVLGRTTLANDPERTLLYLQIASFNRVTRKTLAGAPTRWSPHELAATGTPVMFVVGQEDVICPPSLIRAMHALVPGSRYAEIPRGGALGLF